MKSINLLLVSMLLFLSSAYANVYYVNSSIGDDLSIASEDQPWKTINKAASTLLAGDTVYIVAGTYTPVQMIAPANSGSIDNYINYLAYPGDEGLVIIDGVDIPLPNWYGVFTLASKSYIRVSGLKVINSLYAGFYIEESTNIIIENNSTYQSKSSGISVWDSDLVIVDGNDVSRACWPTGGLQECISIVTSNRVLVKNNLVHDGGSIGFGGGGEGIDIKDGSTNSIVYNNTIHDIASVGIYIDAYETDQSNIHVYANTVYNIFGVGISVASEEGGSLENVIVSRNTVRDCDDRAMVIHWTNKPDYLIKNIFVQHNTFFNNHEGLDIGVHASGSNINIINNIFSQNLVYQMQNSSVDLNVNELHIRNNIIDGANPSWALSGTGFISSSPEFINSAIGDFHLESTSVAIDQGSFLTQTVSSGTGAVIELEDVGFFTDSFGIREGDVISLQGQSQQLQIIDMDYSNNTITIDQDVSWSSGIGVTLIYNASAPDIGAFEFELADGLSNNTFSNTLIYPNPVNDVLIFSEDYASSNYQIMDVNGAIVKLGELDSLSIDLSDLKSGVYIVRLVDHFSKKDLPSKTIVKLL